VAHHVGLQGGMMKLIFSPKPAACSARISSAKAQPNSSISGRPASNLKGTVDDLVENAFNYPTLAEAYKFALDAFNRMPPRVVAAPGIGPAAEV